MEGIEYHIARSEGFKPSEKAFDLEEATVALACASGDSGLAVLAKREIGRFWLDIEKPPYKRLFNPSVSSLYVYHAVLIYRFVERRIAALIKGLEKHSGKKYGVLIHGNRLLAAVTFLRQKSSLNLGSPTLKPEEHVEALNLLVDETVDTLTTQIEAHFSDSFPAVIFKNPTKSKTLFDACIPR